MNQPKNQNNWTNKTFNEVVPSLFETENHDFFYYIFALVNQTLFDDIISLYGAYEPFVEVGISEYFRIAHGERKVDENLFKSQLFLTYADNNGVLSTAEAQSVVLGSFFSPKMYKWRKLVDNVYKQVYTPLDNYDRNEETTTQFQGGETENENSSKKHKSEATGSDTRSDTANSTSQSQKNVFAFNSEEASPSDSDSGTSTSEGTGTTSSQNTVTNTDTDNNVKSRQYNDRKDVVTSRIHGNVGVTTSQQMLNEELLFRNRNDLIQTIYKDITHTLLQLYF